MKIKNDERPVLDPPSAHLGLLALAARVGVGLVMALSGINKAAAPSAEFAAVVGGYYILPSDLVAPFAAILPWLEAITGAFLATGYLTRASSACAGTMFLMFIGALSSTMLRGIPLDNCGCFGGGIHLTPLQGVCLDAALLTACVLLWRRPRTPFALDNWVEQGTL